jgi:hypothetical protein
LTVFSLGAYAVYTHRFFSNRKVGLIQPTLEEKVRKGDVEGVKELFRKYPLLKKKPDLEPFTDPDKNVKSKMVTAVLHQSKSHISRMLTIAAGEGNVKMVEFLFDNGARLEGDVNQKGQPLKNALEGRHIDVAKYLIKKGAKIPPDEPLNFIQHVEPTESLKDNTYLDFMRYLVEKMPKISPNEIVREDGAHKMDYGSKALYETSLIGELARKYYDKNPEKCKEIMRLLIQKGDRPMKIEDPIPAEAHINELLKVLN